jgi:hypothetical protein
MLAHNGPLFLTAAAAFESPDRSPSSLAFGPSFLTALLFAARVASDGPADPLPRSCDFEFAGEGVFVAERVASETTDTIWLFHVLG